VSLAVLLASNIPGDSACEPMRSSTGQVPSYNAFCECGRGPPVSFRFASVKSAVLHSRLIT
jgi:hypothetical protein